MRRRPGEGRRKVEASGGGKVCLKWKHTTMGAGGTLRQEGMCINAVYGDGGG